MAEFVYVMVDGCLLPDHWDKGRATGGAFVADVALDHLERLPAGHDRDYAIRSVVHASLLAQGWGTAASELLDAELEASHA